MADTNQQIDQALAWLQVIEEHWQLATSHAIRGLWAESASEQIAAGRAMDRLRALIASRA